MARDAGSHDAWIAERELADVGAADPYAHAITIGIDLIHTRAHISPMRSDDIISALKADGWYEVGQKGSHIQFKHPTKPGRVTVPHPKRDFPIGTLKGIEKQSGLKLR
jgi:predicted RNA binding protein YcfA (HicA-like mRNA interferase family)